MHPVEGTKTLQEVLDAWCGAGHQVGNHTHYHCALNWCSAENYERDMDRSEAILRPWIEHAPTRYFRFAFDMWGEQREKTDRVLLKLATSGFHYAPISLWFSDTLFMFPHFRALAQKNSRVVAEVERLFVDKWMSQLKSQARNHNGIDIANKTLLITGANRGIGRALVDEALGRGAQRVFAGSRGPLDLADDRVTALTLDVTNPSQIQRAVEAVDTLDVLINNAGVAIYDDLSNLEVVEQHLQVNFLGMLRVTRAFVPLLKRSQSAIVNNLSLAALAALPMIPAYSISKAAAFSMTQSLRALLASGGVTVHGVVLGPVDTDMNRGLEIPKASPESAAAGIFDGLARGEEEIFPDPASQSIAEGWRTGAVKGLERQFAVFAPESAASLG